MAAAPLLASTFLGGAGEDRIYGAARDPGGNVYVVGVTYSSDFPSTAGTFDSSFNGASDAFVAKLDPSLGSLLYGTFLGGSDYDYAAAIAVDPAGNAYVLGHTGSTDFPTTPGAYDRSCGTCVQDVDDVFVAKLDASGNLVYSTYLGGDSGNDDPGAIALDAAGQAVVVGTTWSTDFPTTSGALEASCVCGKFDDEAFVTKLNAAGSGLVYSTYLGGPNGTDKAFGLALDTAGDAFVTGFTESADFPVTPGAYDTTYNGGSRDAFVAEINPAGSALVYATYFGGNGVGSGDYGLSVVVDATGNAYFAGETESSNLPVTANAFQGNYSGGGGDAFLAELDSSGTTLLYGTFLGGSGGEDGANALALGRAGEILVAGWTGSATFPTTLNGYSRSYSGTRDAYLALLDPVTGTMAYGTFLGGSGGEDVGFAVLAGTRGDAYVAGSTPSADFPSRPGAFQPAKSGGTDGFIARLSLTAPRHILVDAGPNQVVDEGQAATFTGDAQYVPTDWSKSGSNPVLPVGNPGAWDSGDVTPDTVLGAPGSYRMWYSGGDGSRSCIGMATSIDGVTWTKYSGNPVYCATLQWEQSNVCCSSVLQETTGSYTMWYRGAFTGSNPVPRIGIAGSRDGTAWTPDPVPVLVPDQSSGSWERQGIGHLFVLRGGGTYHGWYNAFDGTTLRIGYASSINGRNWSKSPQNPLAVGSSWAAGVVGPMVMIKDGRYLMWYTGCGQPSCPRPEQNIGTAISEDGLDWTDLAENPVLRRGPAAWEGSGVNSPYVVRHGDDFRLWYGGSDGTHTRVGLAQTFTGGNFTLTWDFDASVDADGDGNRTNDAEATGPTATHVYGDNGAFVATLNVRDEAGNSASATTLVTVNNVAPTIQLTIIPTGNESDTLTFTARATDPGSEDLTFAWNGDCQGWSAPTTYLNDPAVGPDPYPSPDVHPRDIWDNQTVVCGDNGVFAWSLRVTDDDGGVTTTGGAFSIDNLPPSLTVSPPAQVTIDEGTQVSLTATATDPGSDDLKFAWSWQYFATDTHVHYNDGVGPDPPNSPNGTFPFTATDPDAWTYGDNGNYTVGLTVTDDDGGFVTYTTTVSVLNVPPTVVAGANQVTDEATPVSVSFAFTDPGFNQPPVPTWENFTAAIDWGYGPVEAVPVSWVTGSPGVPTGGSLSATHDYGDNGVFPVTATVCDDDGGCGSASLTVTVRNVAPTIEDLQVYVVASVTLRVAGERWHDVRLDLVWNGNVTATERIVRYPGSPNDQQGTITDGHIQLLGSFAIVVYYTPADDPVNGQPNGANSVWVILTLPDGAQIRLHHTFNVQHPDTWIWILDDFRPYLVGQDITFQATAHDVGSDDLTFAWSFGDGASVSTTHYNNGISPDPYPSPEVNPIMATDVHTHAFAAAGTYTVTLTVTDDDLGTTSARFTLAVGG